MTEFDGEFDADRAKTLIENLRAEIAGLKDEKKALTAQVVDGQALTERAEAAEKAAQDATRALHVNRALSKHQLADDYSDFLTGDTEEEIFARAERLAGLGRPAEAPKDETPAVTRPQSALVGAGEESATPPIDHAAIAAAALGR